MPKLNRWLRGCRVCWRDQKSCYFPYVDNGHGKMELDPTCVSPPYCDGLSFLHCASPRVRADEL